MGRGTDKEKSENDDKKAKEKAGKGKLKKNVSLVNMFANSRGGFSNAAESNEERELYLRVSQGYKDDVGNDVDLAARAVLTPTADASLGSKKARKKEEDDTGKEISAASSGSKFADKRDKGKDKVADVIATATNKVGASKRGR